MRFETSRTNTKENSELSNQQGQIGAILYLHDRMFNNDTPASNFADVRTLDVTSFSHTQDANSP